MAEKRRTESAVGDTPGVLAERIDGLRELVPEAFSEGTLDWEKLREALGEEVDGRPERYSFTWAGKRDAIRMLQTPARGTLVPVPDESVNFETTKNLFIEGENLEVLKLLYRAYYGRVKMIYIDPPYNTGNDFIYPDNFADPLDTYLKLTGQRDSDGNLLTSNPETSGRYHSAWLSMMYPRLFLARQLLREDGVIFVSIDDHEVANLRLIMNEIFGEENFVALIVWKSRQFPDERAVSHVSTDHEYVVVYARSNETSLRGIERDESKFSNPDGEPRGPWMSRSLLGLATVEQRPNLHYTIVDPDTGLAYDPPKTTGWRYSRSRMQRLIDSRCILFPPHPSGRPREKKFRADLGSQFTSFPSIIDDVFTAHGTSEMRDLFAPGVFEFPKPTDLLGRLVQQATDPDDIVLDFFAGSGSVAHAVLALNREDGGSRPFVMVQLPEPTPEGSAARNAGYTAIAEIGKERIRRVIQRMTTGQQELPHRDTPEDLGFKVFKLAPSNVRQWMPPAGPDGGPLSPERYGEQLALFTDPLLPGWKPDDVIVEVALKEGLDLAARVERVAAVEQATVVRVTDTDKDQSLLICLDDTLELEALRPLNLTRADLFICRDSALDDETAANLALQCRLKTI